MIEFKLDVEKILPYNRKNYLSYMADNDDFSVKWYGASFQVVEIADQKDASFQQYLEMYEPLLKNIVSNFDNRSSWIVSHDRDVPWFPNEYGNLPELRTLFRRNDISNSFKGAVIFSAPDLMVYSRQLVAYPYSVTGIKGGLYRDLDISHSELPAIIRISGHLNIDFISTQENIFRKIINMKSASEFVVKEYRGN